MPRYKVTQRCYFNDRIHEPGETVDTDLPPSPYMEPAEGDKAAAAAKAAAPPAPADPALPRMADEAKPADFGPLLEAIRAHSETTRQLALDLHAELQQGFRDLGDAIRATVAQLVEMQDRAAAALAPQKHGAADPTKGKT